MVVSPCTIMAQDPAVAPEFDDQQLEFFESKVRPILIERCYECHGPNAEPRQGGLSLASRTDLLTGGDTGPAVKVGNSKDSLLVDSINYGDVYQMPPNAKIPLEEIEILTKWIDQGAAWPAESGAPAIREPVFDLVARKASHWCWQPVMSPKIPESVNSSWPRDAIDQFILQKLAANNLVPNEPADRHTLIRRVYFDLTGLPPSPQKIQAFVADNSIDAFEKVVDELLASPAFGEHWSRHWMDLNRYAETCGHEFDYPIPHAYEYRDYLIRALNADVPYNQFILEHLAGDLISNPRLHPTEQFNESILGTGFWFLGEAVHAPVDSLDDEAKRIDNQIDVMTKAFLGVTVACARCHDHKFDAISAEDYYALAGFLQSSRRQLAMLDPDRKIEIAFEKTNSLAKRNNALLKILADRLATAVDPPTAGYLTAAIEFLRNHSAGVSTVDGPKLEFDEATVAREAETLGLNPELLKKLVTAITKIPASGNLAHPLTLIERASHSDVNLDNTLLAEIDNATDAYQQQVQSWRENSVPFANFEQGLPAGWFRTGLAFEQNPADARFFSAAGNNVRSGQSLHSGVNGTGFCGVIYSPTFTLGHTQIHCRIRGSGAQVRLIIDGFVMDVYNGLLFQDAFRSVDSPDQFVWLTQAGDLKNYQGHTAHLEIIDHGTGFVEIEEVRFSQGAQPPAAIGQLAAFEKTSIAADQPAVAAIAALGAHRLVEQLKREITGGDRTVLAWIIQNELVDLFAQTATSPTPPTGTSSHSIGAAAESFVNTLVVDVPASKASNGELFSEFKKNRDELIQLNQAIPLPRFAVAMIDGSSEDQPIFIRGNHNTLGDVAVRRFLSAISTRPINPANGSGRLELAQKITAPNSPLVPRVAVNRVWHHLFGRGIVESVDNFGVLGKPPTHPELLDYLAKGFVEDGWSIKRLIRRVVLTSSYQMSSQDNPAAAKLDPNNQWLHRGNVKRLSGEAIRDSMLKISGQLNSQMFGPPVPMHLTTFLEGRGRPGQDGPLDGGGRRSVYQEVRRNFLSPLMLAYDTPIPFSAIGKRNQSNVPGQALILMNDPFVIQQAEQWAKRLVQENQSIEARIDDVYLAATGRPPEDWEREQSRQFLIAQAAELKIDSTLILASEPLWKDFCHVMFNLKEFIFVR